jgi:hypothetical protein
LVILAHDDSPIRHCALAVFVGDFAEGLLRFFVPEGVEKGHAAIEVGFDFGGARGLEVDGAEFFGGHGVVVAFVGEHGPHEDQK